MMALKWLPSLNIPHQLQLSINDNADTCWQFQLKSTMELVPEDVSYSIGECVYVIHASR